MSAPFRRLLLATEHTEQDSGAESLALAMAGHCGMPLSAVLPLLSNPELEMAAPQLAARRDATVAGHRQALEAAARAAGVALDVTVRRGSALFEEIVEVAREQAADLIVIRRRGRVGLLANLLVGEMVSKVVAHAPCSVIVAPRGARMWRQGVLAGLDAQTGDAGVVAMAAHLAGECGVALTLASAAENRTAVGATEASMHGALAQARALHPNVEGEVRIGRAHEVLMDVAQARAADLLVIGRHGPQALARAWIGGTAQKVIGLAACPVLVHIDPGAPSSGPMP